MKDRIIEEILSHKLTKKAIKKAKKESKHMSWVLDEIAELIENVDELDDCTVGGSLLFDKLEERIYTAIGII